MKLTNRGSNAQEAASILEVTEREINNMHSRQTKNLSYVRHIPEPQAKTNYHRCSPCTTQNAATLAQTFLTGDKRQALDEMMNSHLRNIQRTLEHRLQVAKASGDKNLVRLLESESQQMQFSLQ
jgi:hypothetical protein